MNNSIGVFFLLNTIGNNFSANTIGNGFSYNSVGNRCYYLSIVDDIQYLHLKDGTIGNSESNNLLINTSGVSIDANDDTPRTIQKSVTGKFVLQYIYDSEMVFCYKTNGTETDWTKV